MSEGLLLTIRRARRTDFTAVMSLLAAAGRPLPPADRRTLRRFRGIVADLGGDFYLALNDEEPIGLVHITYSRILASPPRARIEELLVAASFHRRGIGSRLIQFAVERAKRHGCTRLEATVLAGASAARGLLMAAAMTLDGERLAVDLPAVEENPTFELQKRRRA